MSDRFVHLQRGLVVPIEAVAAALAIERAGHRLRLDGDDLLIEPNGTLDAHNVQQLRQWKPHVLLLLRYTASDQHLRDETEASPEFSPIVRRPS